MKTLSKIISEINIQGGGKLPFSKVKERLIKYLKKHYSEQDLSKIISEIENSYSIEDLQNEMEDYLYIDNEKSMDIILDLIIDFRI